MPPAGVYGEVQIIIEVALFAKKCLTLNLIMRQKSSDILTRQWAQTLQNCQYHKRQTFFLRQVY